MAKKYSNMETQRLFERNQASKEGKDLLGNAPKPDMAEKAPDSEEEHMEGESESPESIVEAHGRAHTVHVHHNHEGGEHHVHSEHEDGHEHHSKHATAHKAHKHGMALAGAAPEEQEEGAAEAAGAPEEAGAFPTMA